MGTLMQDDMKSVANKYWKAIEIIGLSVFNRLRNPLIHSNIIYQLTNNAKTQNKALADVHFFTTRIIQERRNFLKDNNINTFGDSKDYGKKGNVAMLDLLLQNQKIGKIDDAGVKEEVDTFMFEGHDTTAQAIIYLLMLIANETTAQNKIYEEMKYIFGDSQRTPTMEDLLNMKYLECCIKESLRLYPSVPIIMRYLKDEATLGDYVLPSNTHIHIPIYDLHRREDIYPEPESFIPERFLPENIAKRHPYAYIPFSAGPRNCIGQKFAMLEMKTLVSSLLRRFRLEAVTKPSDLIFRTDIILRTDRNPIYVKFHKRE
ncbi:unnamed protein product, partial [Brenthis ino]